MRGGTLKVNDVDIIFYFCHKRYVEIEGMRREVRRQNGREAI